MSSSSQDAALRQLQSEQSKLLDGIDELRSIGVGGLVELPQLIVCGNQSSGKSSVLEAISRVRFPVKGNLCTRFATEVILRRHPSSSIKVSIEPGSSRISFQEIQKLKEFAPASFTDSDSLPDLIEQAKECMGIQESVNSGFSDDVLKIEISGPDKPELTLVDLPGLYYSTSQDQDVQGIGIVRGLTEKYMKNTRSIILAVISAKADYHLQAVLNIAERFDPQRERTLGIITQADKPEANSEEEETYLQFVKNEKIRLQLGWHALRNRSFETKNDTDEERDEREKRLFNQGRWASIPRGCVGIDSLRSRLSNILFKHIRRNLPGLIADINGKVLDRQQKLEKLGSSRSTLQQQKGFLLNITRNFERITEQALNGMYSDDFFGGIDQGSDTQDFRRLRAIVRELNEHFAEAMEIGGGRRQIGNSPASPPSGFLTNPYLNDWTPKLVRQDVLEAEVSEQARRNRGIELPGSANQLLVGNLFRDQSKPWGMIAERHLITTWESVQYFVSLVLQHLTDEHTYSLLLPAFVEPELHKMREKLLEKLAELTSYNRRGHPLPVGKSFLGRIQKSRSERQFKRLKSSLAGSPFSLPNEIGLEDLENAVSRLEISGDEFAAAEIIDEMQAYYDTAIVTFVDNVATLGIENCLLYPLDSMLTSQTINNMDDKQIQELAAEPSFVREERDRLNAELEKLQAGLRTFASLNVHKPSIPSFAKKVESESSDFLSSTRKFAQPKPSRSAASGSQAEGGYSMKAHTVGSGPKVTNPPKDLNKAPSSPTPSSGSLFGNSASTPRKDNRPDPSPFDTIAFNVFGGSTSKTPGGPGSGGLFGGSTSNTPGGLGSGSLFGGTSKKSSGFGSTTPSDLTVPLGSLGDDTGKKSQSRSIRNGKGKSSSDFSILDGNIGFGTAKRPGSYDATQNPSTKNLPM